MSKTKKAIEKYLNDFDNEYNFTYDLEKIKKQISFKKEKSIKRKEVNAYSLKINIVTSLLLIVFGGLVVIQSIIRVSFDSVYILGLISAVVGIATMIISIIRRNK